MDENGTGNSTSGKELSAGHEPRSLKFSERGIKTASDFANVMSAMMGDLIAGRITPQVGNAVCNEMQHRYGTTGDSNGATKNLALAEISIIGDSI